MSEQYNIAVNAILQHVTATQTDLDKEYEAAMGALRQDLQKLAISGVPTESPEYAVCSLVASTMNIGRNDGYPDVLLPRTTRDVLQAAYASGVLPERRTGQLTWHGDLSGLDNNPPSWYVAYAAWDKARSYRERQTVSEL